MQERAVFISFAQADTDAAEQIDKTITGLGLRTRRGPQSVYEEKQWPRVVGEAISSTDLLLLLWSKDSADSRFVEFELNTALTLKKQIVPCVLDGTPLSPSLLGLNKVRVGELRDSIPTLIANVQDSQSTERSSQIEDLFEKLQRIPQSEPEQMARAGTLILESTSTQESPTVAATDPPAGSAETMITDGQFQLDESIGERYGVMRLLGQGGMGAVYQVYDTVLEREVALKVIRPEIAQNHEYLERFKREIQLSSIVTHKNVLRVYDLGEGPDFKFLTMQYVEGETLSELLRREKNPPLSRLLHLFRQICEGLEAAHEQGVLHRDLKPDNVLVDKEDKVFLTDFGLAKSLQQTAMTQAGQVMGTPDYMSPEQVKGEEVDERSDIYSLGALLYQMVTGHVPYVGNSIYEVMIQRVQKPPRDAKELNPDTPEFLAGILSRSMSIDKEERYRTVGELVEDLDTGLGSLDPQAAAVSWRRAESNRTAKQTAAVHPAAPSATLDWIKQAPVSKRWWYVLGATSLAAALFLAIWLGSSLLESDYARPPSQLVSVAILPFRSEPQSDSPEWLGPALARLLRDQIGQSASLRVVSPARLHQAMKDLRISPETSLQTGTLRRVAESTNVNHIVVGRYLVTDGTLRVEASLEDPVLKNSVPLDKVVESLDDTLKGVAQLAGSVRENLGLSGRELDTVEANSFVPTTGSLKALQTFLQGRELSLEGDATEAANRFKLAVQHDPEFALANAELALSYANQGLDLNARTHSQAALALSEKLHPIERARVTATAAEASSDLEALAEAYRSLAQIIPADASISFKLASLSENSGDLEEARKGYALALKGDPRNMATNLASGRVEIKIGSPDSSLDFLNQALSLAIQGDDKEGRADTMQALGIAYKLLDRPADALRRYEDSLEIKKEVGDRRGMAASLSEIGQIQERMGNLNAARDRFSESLTIRREINDRMGEGVVLMHLGIVAKARGDFDEALEFSRDALQVQMELRDEVNQSLTLNNIGSLYFSQNQYEDAFVYFQRALELREKLNMEGELADSHHNLGETYHRLGQYDNALKQFTTALELRESSDDRSGAALEEYGIGMVLSARGRYGAALESLRKSETRLRQLEGDDSFLAEVLAAYGDTLSQTGLLEDAETVLGEAFQLSGSLRSSKLLARVHRLQGQNDFRRGDPDQARLRVQEALKISKAGGELHEEQVALVFLAEIDLNSTGTKLHSRFRRLQEQSAGSGLRQLSTACSIYAAESLVRSGDFQQAQKELEQLLRRSDELLSKDLRARTHVILGRALSGLGSHEDAQKNFAQAKSLLDEVEKEAGSGRFLQRADIRPLYERAVQGLEGSATQIG